MSPFPRGLLEQVGLAEGDLPSQPQHDYGAVNGVLHGASSARPDALGFSEGASWAAPTAISYVGPGVVHKKKAVPPRGGAQCATWKSLYRKRAPTGGETETLPRHT